MRNDDALDSLTRELAETDWSDESRVRASLRRRLLDRPAGSAPMWRRYPRLVTAAASVLLLTALFVAHPGLRAAVVKPVWEFLQRVVVGEHTEAVVVAPPTDAELEAILEERARGLEDGTRWTMRTAVGTLGGEVPEGRSPVLRTYNSLRIAEAEVHDPFVKPTYLPEAYRFDHLVLTPSDSVVLWYRAPGRWITLVQDRVHPGATTMAMTMGGDSSMQEVTIGGATGAWINDGKLVWEDDGRSYSLEGTELTLADARSIALSLE